MSYPTYPRSMPEKKACEKYGGMMIVIAVNHGKDRAMNSTGGITSLYRSIGKK